MEFHVLFALSLSFNMAGSLAHGRDAGPIPAILNEQTKTQGPRPLPRAETGGLFFLRLLFVQTSLTDRIIGHKALGLCLTQRPGPFFLRLICATS